MSSQLLTVLQLCLLILLYLFFLRVLRAVWTEIKGPAPRVVAATAAGSVAPASSRSTTIGARLIVREPATHAGLAYELADEITVGRAAGCHITLDDTYVSQIHARVFRREGQVLVEDLGSTNGTYLNRAKVGAAMVVQPGDRLQVGSVVLELT